MKKKKIILIVIGVIFLASSIALFIFSYKFGLIEMKAQIEQIGFYKNDVTLLIGNKRKENLFIFLGFCNLIVSVFITIRGICEE